MKNKKTSKIKAKKSSHSRDPMLWKKDYEISFYKVEGESEDFPWNVQASPKNTGTQILVNNNISDSARHHKTG